MPTVFPFVFAPEDEKQFCTFLGQFDLQVYPDRIPPEWVSFKLDGTSAARLDGPSYYLAAEHFAELKVRPVKRGREKGFYEIDETNSPVLHYQRSYVDEGGELRSGRLWCELNLNGDMQKNPAFPDGMRRILLAIREQLHVRGHRSDPSGWVIGAQAARLAKAGQRLREDGRKGIVLKPWK
jgi:hypothetical protein